MEKPLLPMKSKIHNSGGDGNIVDVDFIINLQLQQAALVKSAGFTMAIFRRVCEIF